MRFALTCSPCSRCGTARFTTRPRGNTRGWSSHAIASLSYQSRSVANGMDSGHRRSSLERENKRHVLFAVQSPAECTIHTTQGRGYPLMVYRQKVQGLAVHPILVRHLNHAVLECDQVGGLPWER